MSESAVKTEYQIRKARTEHKKNGTPLPEWAAYKRGEKQSEQWREINGLPDVRVSAEPHKPSKKKKSDAETIAEEILKSGLAAMDEFAKADAIKAMEADAPTVEPYKPRKRKPLKEARVPDRMSPYKPGKSNPRCRKKSGYSGTAELCEELHKHPIEIKDADKPIPNPPPIGSLGGFYGVETAKFVQSRDAVVVERDNIDNVTSVDNSVTLNDLYPEDYKIRHALALPPADVKGRVHNEHDHRKPIEPEEVKDAKVSVPYRTAKDWEVLLPKAWASAISEITVRSVQTSIDWEKRVVQVATIFEIELCLDQSGQIEFSLNAQEGLCGEFYLELKYGQGELASGDRWPLQLVEVLPAVVLRKDNEETLKVVAIFVSYSEKPLWAGCSFPTR